MGRVGRLAGVLEQRLQSLASQTWGWHACHQPQSCATLPGVHLQVPCLIGDSAPGRKVLQSPNYTNHPALPLPCGASALVWDDGIASNAQTWANSCQYQHSSEWRVYQVHGWLFEELHACMHACPRTAMQPLHGLHATASKAAASSRVGNRCAASWLWWTSGTFVVTVHVCHVPVCHVPVCAVRSEGPLPPSLPSGDTAGASYGENLVSAHGWVFSGPGCVWCVHPARSCHYRTMVDTTLETPVKRPPLCHRSCLPRASCLVRSPCSTPVGASLTLQTARMHARPPPKLGIMKST